MFYYEDSKGIIIGRLYECGSKWVGEVGSYTPKAKFCKFFATKSAKFKTYRQAEKYLYDNGCVMAVVA